MYTLHTYNEFRSITEICTGYGYNYLFSSDKIHYTWVKVHKPGHARSNTYYVLWRKFLYFVKFTSSITEQVTSPFCIKIIINNSFAFKSESSRIPIQTYLFASLPFLILLCVQQIVSVIMQSFNGIQR